jgi:GH15 family glucan-1,4-alpha-glucosidase
MEPLGEWLERQYRHSAKGMMRSVSATAITHIRAGFGQRITPKPGSVVASPVPGAYDPDPDYFFHWFRDSALVVDALRLLCLDGGAAAAGLRHHFADFVRFSLELESLDGQQMIRSAGWRQSFAADYLQFVRGDEDLAAVRGEFVAADTRVNPDGSLDISRWARPQYDGPALRALCVLRWLRDVSLDPASTDAALDLLHHDLDFTLRHWADPCYDIWEEELGVHYYTLRVSAAAMSLGCRWLKQRGDRVAIDYSAAAHAARARLNSYWDESRGYLRSRFLSEGRSSTKQLDISVILAAIHTADAGTPAIDEPQLLATFSKLEALFEQDYAINRDRPRDQGVAMGRYHGDVYFSGGAYFFSTLGAAEFCFRAAATAPDPREFLARGDAFLETVRRFTPANGDMSEQFDQTSGAARSAPQLAWSYAALISSVAARNAVRPRGA